jgi:hypothetical protein
MSRAASLLLVFALCAALALVLELGRHLAPPADASQRDFLLGIEGFVWIVASCALLRRYNLRA